MKYLKYFYYTPTGEIGRLPSLFAYSCLWLEDPIIILNLHLSWIQFRLAYHRLPKRRQPLSCTVHRRGKTEACHRTIHPESAESEFNTLALYNTVPNDYKRAAGNKILLQK